LGVVDSLIENLKFNSSLVGFDVLVVAVFVLFEGVGVTMHRVIDLLAIAPENLFMKLDNFLPKRFISVAHAAPLEQLKR
jgi:hypothetical protein